jgi:hypothetical protein
MITMHSWMFLSSFEKLRERLLSIDTVNMAYLGARAFKEIGGEVVQTTSFVFRKSNTSKFKGTYYRLIDPNTQDGKEEMFLAKENRFKVDELANSLQVCLDSGAKKVLLPITSAADLATVPSELIGCFNLIFYQSAEDAVFKALGVE